MENNKKKGFADLEDCLYGQLDRLSNSNLRSDELGLEIDRAKAITDTATQIVKIKQTQLRSVELLVRSGQDLPQGNAARLLAGGGENGK